MRVKLWRFDFSHPFARSAGAALPEPLVEAGAADSGVSTDATGRTVTWQRIAVGRRRYGRLIAITGAPLSNVGRILLGHASSLLALDFAKTAQLAAAQRALHSQALELALSAGSGPSPARELIATAADRQGRIRVVVVECLTDSDVGAVRDRVDDTFEHLDHPHVAHTRERRITVLLPADGAAEFAHHLAERITGPGQQHMTRIGIGAAQPLSRLADAADTAVMAAAAAARGGAPVEFGASAGTALLASEAGREVLNALTSAVLEPLVDHDTTHGSDLFASLRAYLEANGHGESAASSLGIHRHTMRKRLTMIQAILDCDLSIAGVRAELLLAILARSTRT